jgi:hypothetical protein
MTEPTPDSGGTGGASDPGAPKSGGVNPGAFDQPINLGKSSDPTADAPFDPYRFGRPDHPVPPEFAPPGYSATGYSPVAQPSPYAAQTPPTYPAHQPPGGPPAPPWYHGYPQPRTGNGKATAALVLGILSIVFFWLSVFDLVFIILALVFGLLGLSESRRQGGNGRGLAIAGLVCMGVGAAAAILWTATLFHTVGECGGFDANTTNSSAFEQCVRDNFP